MADVHKVGPYVIGNTIGAGVTGKVRLAFDKNTGLQVAVKIVRKDLLEDGAMAVKILREIAVMKVLDHEFVLHLYDFYEDLEHMFLVLEYAPNGDVYDYLIKKGVLKNEEAFRIFQQIIEGLDHCHKHLICHRDLKPENLLLDAANNVKLADFGMCGIEVKDSLFKTSCGSPHYASPEVIEGTPYDGTKADIWSCGVILYALVTGKLPFDDNNLATVLEKVKIGTYETPACVHADIQDLISKMLVTNPEERISIAEIRKHSWFRENSSVSVSHVEERITKQSTKPISGEYSNDFVKTISDLGFGDSVAIEEDLESDEASLIKTFYGILEERARNKRPVPVSEKGKSKLNRAKSEAMLPLSKVSKTFRTSSNQLGNSISRARESKRVGSMNGDALVKIEHSDSKELSPSGSPLRASGKDAKRARFLPSWFGSSDSHLKKDSKEVIESTKSFTEITTELEETLDSMDSTYSFSKKRDKIKAKITRESKTVRFSVNIGKGGSHSENSPQYVISFSRRGGDKDTYCLVCDNIRRLLDI